MEDLTAFGVKLHELRCKAGLTQAELAESMGVGGDRIIRRWEKPPANAAGRRRPSQRNIDELITQFKDYLSPAEAGHWVALAGYSLKPDQLTALRSTPLLTRPQSWLALPALYQPRPSLEAQLCQQLLSAEAAPLLLTGMGGAGKSTLAAWLARETAAHFIDGIIWLDMAQYPTILESQAELAGSLGLVLSAASLPNRAGQLRAALAGQRVLIIIDDARCEADLIHLLVTQLPGQTLFTTRDAKTSDLLDIPAVPVGNFSSAEGVELFRTQISPATAETSKVEALVERLGGLPLAIVLAGAQVRQGVTPDDLLADFALAAVDLSVLDMDDPQTRRESLHHCFEISLTRLTAEACADFSSLGLFAGRFDLPAVAALWHVSPYLARKRLQPLLRYMLVNQQAGLFALHPLLRDFARHKLNALPVPPDALLRRHADWFIRRVLYHPGLLDKHQTKCPSLAEAWPDVVGAVRRAAEDDQFLATWAVVFAFGDRSALFEAVGEPLVAALETTIAQSSYNPVRALFTEQLAYLSLWAGRTPEAIRLMAVAVALWRAEQAWLPAAMAQLRLAGLHLLAGSPSEALAAVKIAQGFTRSAYPVAQGDLEDLRWVFFWLEMLFQALVRWNGCSENDAKAVADLAEESGYPIVAARGLRIQRLWWTAEGMERLQTPADREQVTGLAVRLFWLWRSVGERDQADREVTWTAYALDGRYSRRVAARFGRRLSAVTPVDFRPVKNRALAWWMNAAETQRVAWFSRMMPRYQASTNAPGKPLARESRAYQWVEAILALGTAGSAVRKPGSALNLENTWINIAEAAVFSGQKPLPLVGGVVRDLVVRELSEDASGE